MKVLITGGAGYIGSHTVLCLHEAGHDVVVLDNLSNSSVESLKRVGELTNKCAQFIEGDIRDEQLLNRIFNEHAFDAVIHFAGLKAVGESVARPDLYYDNNVNGSMVLMRAMKAAGVMRLVFSSSATVYGDPASLPITEDFPLSATNPYGWSKLMVEQVCRDAAVADENWQIALLRYFNPVGAHESGRIGEDPNDIPNNLMPFISQVAVGKRAELSVFGDDYDTHDGTGVRDYIHVMDLARGHLAALNYLPKQKGCEAYNLGTGNGYSVLDMVKAFETQNQVPVPYRIAPRRPGDIAACYANAGKAEQVLGWTATMTQDDMVRDTWRWQSHNPNGYK
ncbi:UDP-glucose 4-epimerase GalE [Salinibius halmophilus]|uniref:UDP-glucose 4-epimerase GalE n=1 Tax=Salinibius halmophilus TaxID=1853216 RepID=UPI000E66945A|nr:UDP-glucose 4-epimerase GalE [Salinibius halmophilus]